MFDWLIFTLLGSMFGMLASLLINRVRYGNMKRNFDVANVEAVFVELIRDCKEELLIVTDLDPKVFGKTIVLNALEDATRRGCEIRVLVDGRVDIDSISPFKGLADGRIFHIQLDGVIPFHYLIADRKHVLLELHHNFGEMGRGTFLVNAIEIAERLSDFFDELWAKSRIVGVSEVGRSE